MRRENCVFFLKMKISKYVVTDSSREMYEVYKIAQQAKYKYLRIDEMCKISDGWNVPNWLW